jgi:hypothetical protein
VVDQEWYAFGEVVLDRILGLSRAEAASIYFRTRPPLVKEVRRQLGLPPYLTIEMTNDTPRMVATIDQYVILKTNRLYNITSATYDVPESCNQLVLTTYDLSVQDILRLHRLIRGYPELASEPKLVERLEADLAHLTILRQRFPELDLLFIQYETLSRWRHITSESEK